MVKKLDQKAIDAAVKKALESTMSKSEANKYYSKYKSISSSRSDSRRSISSSSKRPVTYTVKPGDTANKIAQMYGFSNYKTAGITGFSSGNPDLIFPGETLTIGNYKRPVVTSLDVKEQYNSMQDDLKTNIDAINAFNLRKQEEKSKIDFDNLDEFKPGLEPKAQNEAELYKLAIADDANKLKQIKLDIAAERKKLDEYINNSLADIDAQYQATVSKINNTFDAREREFLRLKQLDIATRRAYGLATGGQYNPIMFRNAISEVEQKYAKDIAELNMLREQALREAEAAMRKSRASIFKQKFDAALKLQDRMNELIREVSKESEKQYELLVQMRKRREAELDAKRNKMVALLKAYIAGNYDKFKTSKNLNEILKDISEKAGVDISVVYDAYRAVQQDRFKDELNKLDKKYKEARINKELQDMLLTKEKRNTEKSKQYYNYKKAKELENKNTNTSSGSLLNEDDPLGIL